MVGISAGIIGPVYRHVLAYEIVLNWWYRIGQRWEKRWFFRPIWGCEKCVAGQIALWGSLVVCLVKGVTGYLVPVVILGILSAICIAITVAIILTKPLKNHE